MGEIRIEEQIEASPDAVWKLLGDFGAIGEWASGIDRCEVEGDGVGCVRVIHMGGATFRERLESLDDASHRFSYSILEAPIPLQNYLAQVSLHEIGPGRTRLEWSSRFDTPGMSEEQARALVGGMEGGYRRMIADIRKRVG